jgi:DoxX-like family
MNASTRRRTAIVLSVIVVGFLTVDALLHLANPDVVREASRKLGLAENKAPLIGVVELCGVATFLWRRTSLVGAILLTGFLGGAVAINLRAEQPVLGTTLFPIYFMAALWASLILRDNTIIARQPVASQTLTRPNTVIAEVLQ